MDISDERIINFAPSFRLDPIAAKLFESDRPWSYGFDFPTTDRKLLALEYHEFASCIRNNTPPEVGGTEAMRAVSLVYALFESQATGCAVSLADIESSQ